jgi:hypothetical protein
MKTEKWHMDHIREQYSVYSGKRCIARTDTAFEADEKAARLISAAPELLNILKAMMQGIEIIDEQDITSAALVAIAKAEGSNK